MSMTSIERSRERVLAHVRGIVSHEIVRCPCGKSNCPQDMTNDTLAGILASLTLPTTQEDKV